MGAYTSNFGDLPNQPAGFKPRRRSFAPFCAVLRTCVCTLLCSVVLFLRPTVFRMSAFGNVCDFQRKSGKNPVCQALFPDPGCCKGGGGGTTSSATPFIFGRCLLTVSDASVTSCQTPLLQCDCH